jgi:hypothetical protein
VLSLKLGSLFEAARERVVAWPDAPRINMGGVGAMEKLLTPRSGLRCNCCGQCSNRGPPAGKSSTINCDVEVVHVVRGSLRVRLVTGCRSRGGVTP